MGLRLIGLLGVSLVVLLTSFSTVNAADLYLYFDSTTNKFLGTSFTTSVTFSGSKTFKLLNGDPNIDTILKGGDVTATVDGTGTVISVSVTAPAKVPNETYFENNFLSIFSGTVSQQVTRWLVVSKKYPLFTQLTYFVFNRMSPAEREIVKQIATDIKSQIGVPVTEILTLAEYTNLQAIAITANVGDLFP